MILDKHSKFSDDDDFRKVEARVQGPRISAMSCLIFLSTHTPPYHVYEGLGHLPFIRLAWTFEGEPSGCKHLFCVTLTKEPIDVTTRTTISCGYEVEK